jgi:hypothetical protein
MHVFLLHESAFGTKRTSELTETIFAFGGKADIDRMYSDIRL